MSADRNAATGRIVVCATPIGNLDDVTARVLAALADADVVACEDTRHTRTLLQRFGITTATVSLHEHNEAARSVELVDRAAAGGTVAVVSDAGMPVVSDPGGRLVAAARDAGVRVEVLPGPSAPPTAIAAAGLPAERWRFVGFLPRRAAELLDVLRSTETTVAFESPRRLSATLAAIADEDADRPVAVCRELTKLHEEVVRGPAGEVAARFAGDVRGEITLVVAGVAPDGPDAADARAAVDAARSLVDGGARAKVAARVVAGLTGLRPNDLYRALHDD
ncbi:MAG: 16S rRNA (cytidine(1402)-2'-O)-methyltransferase [Solirubrobacteraceae bacterium]|nr:16S rRNA (cytidine(1402)-2'-O)-methyltransferase [Solirubrobacteraceae bacterium]